MGEWILFLFGPIVLAILGVVVFFKKLRTDFAAVPEPDPGANIPVEDYQGDQGDEAKFQQEGFNPPGPRWL